MVKTLLSTILLGSALSISAQFNGAYLFTAVTNTTGATDPTPVPTAPNVTFGAFTAVGLSANSSGSGRFSFTGWGTGASTLVATVDTYSAYTGSISLTQYYQVGITPANGYAINFNKLYFNMRRSGTGVRNYAVRASVGGYAANLPASVVPTNTALAVLAGDIFFWTADATSTTADQKGSTISLSGSSFQNVTTATNFRFYAWNAESNAGTFSLDSVDLSGTAILSNGLKDYAHSLQAGFKLYPNPSNQQNVMIEALDKSVNEIEVMDVLGKVVYVQKIQQGATSELTIANLQAGTYFVRMKSESKSYVEKLIISERK
jgi:hypothetical protein